MTRRGGLFFATPWWFNNQKYCEGGGKRKYKTQKQAIQVANYRMSQGAEPLKVYQCKTCTQWHLSKQLQYGKTS